MSHTHAARKASRLAVVAALAAVGALLLVPSGAAGQGFGNFPPDQPGFGNFPPDEPRFGNFPPDEPRFGNFPPDGPGFGNFPPDGPGFGNFPPDGPGFGNFPPDGDGGQDGATVPVDDEGGDEVQPGGDRGGPLRAEQVPAAEETGLADTGISEALLLALLAGGIVAAATAMRMRLKREGT
jgi:hypothetical protein